MKDQFYDNTDLQNTYYSRLSSYINEPEVDYTNFNLAIWYHSTGHTAAAVSFYIRTAERTNNVLLKYESLLQASMCFREQGSRSDSVIGLLQHAVSILPSRPEAYFLLSRYYEETSKWFDGYMMASLGLTAAKDNHTPLNTQIDYPGTYGLLFEKAVTAWWCGLCEESLDLFEELLFTYNLEESYKQACINNLKNFGRWSKSENLTDPSRTLRYISKEQELEASMKQLNLYDRSKSKLINPFNNSDIIERNYSKAFQDLFVLTTLKGKQNGFFVEVGTENPFYGNNTFLLESKFDWKGISIDWDRESAIRFIEDRKSKFYLADDTMVDYRKLFELYNAPTIIDYLQVACQSANSTYEALTRMPWYDYKFRTITFKHNLYLEGPEIRDKAREFLLKKGYVLVACNVCSKEGTPYEDWYHLPESALPNYPEEAFEHLIPSTKFLAN